MVYIGLAVSQEKPLTTHASTVYLKTCMGSNNSENAVPSTRPTRTVLPMTSYWNLLCITSSFLAICSSSTDLGVVLFGTDVVRQMYSMSE